MEDAIETTAEAPVEAQAQQPQQQLANAQSQNPYGIGIELAFETEDSLLSHCKKLAALKRGDNVVIRTQGGNIKGVFLEGQGPIAIVLHTLPGDERRIQVANVPWAFVSAA